MKLLICIKDSLHAGLLQSFFRMPNYYGKRRSQTETSFVKRYAFWKIEAFLNVKWELQNWGVITLEICMERCLRNKFRNKLSQQNDCLDGLQEKTCILDYAKLLSGSLKNFLRQNGGLA